MVEYSPSERILLVEVVMDHVMTMGDVEASGSGVDYFMGRISEDGKTWYAWWVSFIDYANLPVEPEEADIQYAEFKKVEDFK